MNEQNSIAGFMQRAIDLACLADHRIQSNPRVGCVLVRDGQIIGEGWHAVFGEGHAEVRAYQDAVSRGFKPDTHTTVFVTLEPCGHAGKTPPCALLLARFRPAMVYILQHDPNVLTRSKGPEILAKANVPYRFIDGCGTKDLIRRFRTNVLLNKAYFTLKYAETSNGFIGNDKMRIRISNEFSSRMVHKMRSEHDAIMIGRQTLELDNPALNLRYYPGKDPVKIVVSQKLDFLPNRFQLFSKNHKVIVLTSSDKSLPDVEVVRIEEWNWSNIRQYIFEKAGINSVLVEGGCKLLQSIIDAGEWDEIIKITSPDMMPLANIPGPLIKSGILSQTMYLATDKISFIRPAWGEPQNNQIYGSHLDG